MGGGVLGRLIGDIGKKAVPDVAGEFAETLATKPSDVWTSGSRSASQIEGFGGALPWKVEGFQLPTQTSASLAPNPAREVLNTAIQEGPIAGYKSRGTQLPSYPIKKKTIGGEHAEALFNETFTNPGLANVPLGRNLLAPARAALDYRVFDIDFGKPAPNFDEVRQGDVVRFKGGPLGNRNAKAQRVTEYIIKPRGDLELISGKTPGNYADVSRSGGNYYKNNPVTGNRERISPSEFHETVDKSDVDRASVKIWRDRNGVRHEVRTEDPTGIFPAYQESARVPIDYTEIPRGADAIKERINLERALREWPGLKDPIERLEDLPARHRAAIMRINSNPAGMIDTQLRVAWEFIDNLPETLSEGLSMRTSSKVAGTVYPGRAAAMYDPITSVMTIDMNQANVRTLIHEFFHHISRFIPVRELDGLRRQYVMELLGGTAQARLRDFYDGIIGRSRGLAAVRKALKSDAILHRRFKEIWDGDIAAVPDEQLDEWIKKLEENGYFNETNPAPVIGIVGGEGVTLPSFEDLNRLRNMSYRYKNFNEWLAEVFTDRALIETLARVVPGYLGTIERIMLMLRDWMVTGYNYATFRGYKNSSRSIYNNLMNGTWEPPARWGTLSPDAKKATPTTPAGRWGTLGVGEPLGARQDIALGRGGERFTDQAARELEERFARGERVVPFSLPGLEGYASDEVSSLAYLGDIAGGNPEKLLRRMREEGEDLPAIFMSAGEGMYDMPTNIQTSLKIAPEMRWQSRIGDATSAGEVEKNKMILRSADETLARRLQTKSPEQLRDFAAARMAVYGYTGFSENSTEFMVPRWVPGSGMGYQLMEEAFSTSPRPIAQWTRAGLEQLFTPTRTLLREQFGDFIHLHRSQTPETRYGAQDVAAGRNTLSYFPTKSHADSWQSNWNLVISRDVSVDDIVWVSYRSQGEPEFIVRSGEQFAVSPEQWIGRPLIGEGTGIASMDDPMNWMLNESARRMGIAEGFGADDFEEFIQAILFKDREVSGRASRYSDLQPLTKQGLEEKIAAGMKGKKANASSPPRYQTPPPPSQTPPPPMSGVKTEDLAIFDTWKGHVTAKLVKRHDEGMGLLPGYTLVHEDSLPILKTSSDLGMEGFDLGELPVPKLIFAGNIPGLSSVPAHKWAGELKSKQARDALTDAPLGFTQDLPPVYGSTVHGKPLDAQYTKNLSAMWTQENGVIYEHSMGMGKDIAIEESWFHMPLSAQVHDAVWDGSMFQLAEHEWVRHMQSVPWLMETAGKKAGKRGGNKYDILPGDIHQAIEEYLQVMQAYSYYTPMSAKHTAEWGFDQSANMDYWIKLLDVAVEDKWPAPDSVKGKLMAALAPVTHAETVAAAKMTPLKETWAQESFTWVSGQKGSMPGGLYKHNASGIHYYIKDTVANTFGHEAMEKAGQHIKQEALAGALYKLAGVPVADTREIIFGSMPALMSRWIPDATKMSFTDMSRNADVRSNFVVDAWLANWDVVGLNADNIVLGTDDVAYRIDHGGALEFRAQGGTKHFSGNEVQELTSMLNLATAPEGSRVFKSLTLAELEAGAKAVGSITDEMIEVAVMKANFLKEAETRLIKTLKARRDIVVKEILGEGYVPPPAPSKLTQGPSQTLGEAAGLKAVNAQLYSPAYGYPTSVQWYGHSIGDSGPLAPNERTDEFIEFVLAGHGQTQVTTLQYEGGKSIIFGGNGDFKQLPMEGVNYSKESYPPGQPLALDEIEWMNVLQGEFQHAFDKQMDELIVQEPNALVEDLVVTGEVLKGVTNTQMEAFFERMIEASVLVPGWGTVTKSAWTEAEMVHYYKSLAQIAVVYSHQGAK